jgi:hypothetical protein
MNRIDQPTAPAPASAAGATDAPGTVPAPPEPQLRIDGEQADRLLRSSSWQQ